MLAELEEEVRNRGGGAIDRLERDAQAARNRLGDARDLRRRLEGYLTDIGRALPQDEETFDALMQESEGFLASYDELHGKLEDELLASAVHEQQLAAQERDLASHLQFYEQHPVNITKRMISDRQRISRATGIPEEELPYAAELMDIAEGQEEWRDAANVGFHGLATLMLVDRARLDEFSVRLNRVQLDHRVSFQGVRPRAFKAPRSDANRLSSKIVFARESPFAAWVAEWVHDTNHDYICVDRPEELGGRGQRITREGQTRQRSRGAHGFNRHDTLIIGFTNKARVQEIRSELAGVRAELSKERAKLDESKRELAALGKRRDAALQLQPLRWEALDEFALQAKLDDLLAQIEQLRQDQTLAQLLEQRKQQDALVSRLTEEQGASRREREQEDLQAKAAHGASQEASERAHTLEAAGSTVSAEQEELIASYAQRAEQPYLGTDDAMGYLARNYDATVASLTRSMRNRARTLDNDARERTEALEKTFASYRDHWLDYDDPLGTTVESYPDYLRILEELEAEQLDLHIDDWLIDTLRRAGAGLSPLSRAYTTDLREIRRRMRPINDIMSNFKFGPDEGELEIVVTERSPKAIRGFREELAQWARLATQAEFDDPDRLHHQLRAFMAKLEEALVQKARGPLNTKNLVYITVVAHYPKREDLPDKAYSSLGAKSGGETQELIAFILGAALLFCLGDNS